MSLANRNRSPSSRSSPNLEPRTPNPARRRRRRGVLLLVVLSVLVLFVLLTVTYVIVATKERVTAKAVARVELSGDPPAQLLDSLAMTIFRGSADIHSPFQTWSLLEGIYGNANFHGNIGKNSGVCDGSVASAPRNKKSGGQFYYVGLDTVPAGYKSYANYYAGCVFTMLNGPCAGLSTRVVGSDGTGLVVMRFHADSGLLDPALPDNTTTPKYPGDAFLVNAPAYSGMGRGYDPTFGTLGSTSNAPCGLRFTDKADGNKTRPYALLPNYTGIVASVNGAGSSAVDPTANGGANVDYTAYDYNNMYLGLLTNYTPPAVGPPTMPPVLPSFHRSDLYAYWAKQPGGITTSLKRQILFRPNDDDHPIFCGATNPRFSALADNANGVTLDVANMRLGVFDSIWIDPGLPVMTSKDGRTYKVLVAPLILDLDGRVNVNAHGGSTLVDPNFNYPASGRGPINSAGIAGGGSATVPIGECYGPAEVNLLQSNLISPQEMKYLLQGNISVNPNGFPGRHGSPSGAGNKAMSSIASRSLAAIKSFEYPYNDYRLGPLTSFGTPPDIKGRRFLALDYRGLPLYLTKWGADASDSNSQRPNPLWHAEVFGDAPGLADSPYGFNLSAPMPGRYVMPDMANANLDDPFTVAELERVMRPYDIDSRSLAPRLAGTPNSLLYNTLQSTLARAGQITTESWDVPVPSLAVPRYSFTDATGATTDYRKAFASANPPRAFQITDMVRKRLEVTKVPKANWDGEIANILAPELIAGLRMDINRPFGNGRDDNGTGTVDGVGDEDNRGPQGIVPGLSDINDLPPSPIWPISYPLKKPWVQFNITNGVNGNMATDPLLANPNVPPRKAISAAWKARQLMARHLYVLMMLFTDQRYVNWTTQMVPPLTMDQKHELTARRVAQWAINAVSFRDSTSAMVPFEYHWDIFGSGYKGWTAKGDLTDVGRPGDSSTDIRVVWGCKPPDLVMTETLAFHDRATADTKFDDGQAPHKNGLTTDTGPQRDPNFDQVRVPQGSLFVELYCCRNPNNPVAPGDLYTYKNGKLCLELSKQAPDGKPVWRMLITGPTTVDDQQYPSTNISAAMDKGANTFTIQNGNDDNGTTLTHLNVDMFAVNDKAKVDRIIWLGTSNPPNPAPPGLFRNWYQKQILVPAASYAVIGPRSKTYVGSTTKPYCVKDSTSQLIALDPKDPKAPNAVDVATANTSLADPSAQDRKPAVAVVVAADPPAGWANAAKTAPEGIGLSVSEPLPTSGLYYPEPTVQDPGTGIMDAYGGTPNGTNNGLDGDSAKPFRDNPLEIGTGDRDAAKRPLKKENVQNTGTHPFFKHVLLQRLANPLVAWDALTNPYITVDWMPIDLTTFSGEQAPGSADPDDRPGPKSFASRERGYPPPPPNPNWVNDLWSHPLPGTQLPKDIAGQPANANFQHLLQQTIGYLNHTYGQGSLATDAQGPAYAGDPQTTPFPWITWNARPYVSVMELLQVPATSPDRLLRDFVAPGSNPNKNAGETYRSSRSGLNGSTDFLSPFGHLLNFFNTADEKYAAGDKPTGSANFYRVLDYLTVPSRFVGTETMLNPNVFSATNTALAPFLPPFNSVSNYRDPGRININTITSQEVWNALINGGPGPNFSDFVDSRRGDGVPSPASGPLLVTGKKELPTSFNGVFRSAASADLVPLPVPAPPPPLNPPLVSMTKPGVNATLLRPDKNGVLPLFGSMDPKNWTNTTQLAYNDSSRNPYFAYQGLERISNNVTTRSNVFAVWLTVGYFEVLPWPQAGINPPPASLKPADYAAHADGYQLGAELGSDTGTIERHRAFYIFDRSIPVGFERGQNHNVNRAILLRRYIE